MTKEFNMSKIRRKCLVTVSLLMALFLSGFTVRKENNGYKLKEVVVLSRHNIRSPLSDGTSVLGKATPHEWFPWSSAASELSLRGGILETEMGEYFRKWVVSEDLMSENYHPKENEVRFYANSLQRTIATAQYFSSGFLPVANVRIETHMPFNQMDPVFDPKLTFLTEDYQKEAEKEMLAMIPDLSEEYALLTDIIDFHDSPGYKSGELTDFNNDDNQLIFEAGKEPILKGSLANATSLADALVLQSYEEADKKKAAFGKDLTEDQWKKVSSIKDVRMDVIFTTPLIACHMANPLLQVIDSELERDDRKFTFLCGHDSNLASVLGALNIRDYIVDQSEELKTPIGSKLVFEKWEDQSGKEYVRLRLVYQNTEQLRGMPVLTLENPPMSHVFEIPTLESDENGMVPYDQFNDYLDEKIKDFDRLKERFGVTEPTINYTKTALPDTADR